MAEIKYNIPTKPLMAPEAVERLSRLLGKSQCFLEYGAGGSTRLAASLDVPNIFTVESDPEFLNTLEVIIAQSGSKSRLHMHRADIGPTKEWGYPLNNNAVRGWPSYTLEIWNVVKTFGMMPDLVLVDGRFRVACALASIIHILPGRFIWLDDYVGRENNYQIISRHARLSEIVGKGAIFETMKTDCFRELALDLARYTVVLE
jgi:hypothetical protein